MDLSSFENNLREWKILWAWIEENEKSSLEEVSRLGKGYEKHLNLLKERGDAMDEMELDEVEVALYDLSRKMTKIAQIYQDKVKVIVTVT